MQVSLERCMQVASLSWHLETVSVSDPQGQTFYFRCDEWVEREQVVLFPSFDPLHVGYTVGYWVVPAFLADCIMSCRPMGLGWPAAEVKAVRRARWSNTHMGIAASQLYE